MQSPDNIPVTHIRPSKGWAALNLRELWQNRELLYFFTWRDIKVRYKQTLLGCSWAVIVPLVNAAVFTILFGKLANLPTDGLPRPVFYMAGLVVWNYFASSLTSASNSMVGNAGLITKVYFPRLLIPLSACLTGLVDFVVALGALLVLMLYYGALPAAAALLLPCLTLVALVAALGAGLVFAALNVRYRDVRALVPILVQLWMYCTVIMPFSIIPERYAAWRTLYALNPMAGVVEGFRWCLMHNTPGATLQAPWPLLPAGAGSAVLLLLLGIYYFRKMEDMFADIV